MIGHCHEGNYYLQKILLIALIISNLADYWRETYHRAE